VLVSHMFKIGVGLNSKEVSVLFWWLSLGCVGNVLAVRFNLIQHFLVGLK